MRGSLGRGTGIVFLAVVLAAPLGAATRIVPTDYPTIQDAVDAAVSGDTVHIQVGNYLEHVLIDKALTLEGEDRTTTVIDGGGSGKTVISTADGVIIRGLTITGGGADGTAPIEDAGVVVQYASGNLIEDCIITHNGWNGVFFYYASNSTIRGSEISHNNAPPGYRGAIQLRYSSHNTFEGNEIHSHISRSFVGRSSSNFNVVRDNWFHDNASQAVHIGHSSNATVSGNLIERDGSGVVFDGGSTGSLVTGNVIRLCTGPALRTYFYATGVTFVENLLEGNAVGVWVDGRNGGQTYYHNDIIGNTEQVRFVNGVSANTWDNGYPGGGNYWSDYSGVDAHSGPAQDEPEPDGLGDTPHALVIYGDTFDQDRYPLMLPWSSPDEDGDGWVAAEDCDDTDPQVHPEALEVCDGIDNDCNGEIDESPSCEGFGSLEPGDIVVADYNGDFGKAGAPWDSTLPGGRIVKVDPVSGAQALISSGALLDLPWGLALHPGGYILVADRGSSLHDPTPEIVAIDPTTGAQRVVSAGGLLVAPMDLDVDAAGHLLVADHRSHGSGAIIHIDPATGSQSLVATGGALHQPMDVAISATGDAYVSCTDNQARLIVVKVDPATGAQTVVSPAQECCAVDTKGIVRDEASGDLYVSEIYTHNGIFRVDGATGTQSLFTSGWPFQDPWDLTWSLDGDLVVGDGNWWSPGRVIRVGLPTGAHKTVISEGGLLVDPAGVGVVPGPCNDFDGDGYGLPAGPGCPGGPEEDCDDFDPDTFPGAPELCDGLDNDCDGLVDDEPVDGPRWWFDYDGDGYGGEDSIIACTQPPDAVPEPGDCDDFDSATYPGATELCDGRDNDCDGILPLDELDHDGDGMWACQGDCDDGNPSTYLGAPELCDGRDNDCDGSVPLDELDHDGDGMWACQGDCDDANPAIYLGAPELCDGRDNDCDGSVPLDELDHDGDGMWACQGDCDDGNPSIYLGAPELCDGRDNDCDGSVPLDELDHDGDGMWACQGDCDDGNPSTYLGAPELCDGRDNDCDGSVPLDELDHDGDGMWACQGDCDDANPAIYLGAPELCDGRDNDCDGSVPLDELDHDGDGMWACQGDCDDGNPGIYLGAPELCDGRDNDCDGSVPLDELDHDGDGMWACQGDCDDGNPSTYLGAPELCDGRDNDCDGSVPLDELDHDGDGMWACQGDCDDANPAIYLGAPELCDGLDNDCDGSVPLDELDHDGDGMWACQGDCDDGNPSTYLGAPELCDGRDNDCDGSVPLDELDHDGDGMWACQGDCDDANPAIYLGAPELCDGLDNDCDGTVPLDEADADIDGFRICGGDCDDGNPGTYPGAPELCDRLDNDCDGVVPLNEADGDGDGSTPCEGDCNDQDPSVHPGAPEVCDSRDNDCNGDIDEGTPDGDGDEVCDQIDNCPGDSNPGQENCDGDTTGDACDADDTDADGLTDAQEISFAAGICPGGCPDPTDHDSDADGLLDGYESDADPDKNCDFCSADTDGDGVQDAMDPFCNDPTLTGDCAQDLADLEAYILSLPTGVFQAPGANTEQQRRQTRAHLASIIGKAAKHFDKCQIAVALVELYKARARVDGAEPPLDDMVAGTAEKASVLETIDDFIYLFDQGLCSC